MGARSRRKAIREQGRSALIDLDRASDKLAKIGLIADSGTGSKYIDDHLPDILAGLEMLKAAIRKFWEGL